MGSENPGLNYEIKVTGGSQGAAELAKVTDATTKVGGASTEGAKGVKNLADEVGAFASRTSPAREGVEGLTMAARGGENAWFGLSKVIRATQEIATKGFAAIGVGGLVIAGLTLAVTIWNKIKEASAAAAEQAKKSAEQTASAIDKLNQSRLDNLQRSVKDVDEAAASMLKNFDRAAAARDRLDSAEKAAKLAVIRNSAMSDDEKAAASARVEEEFANRADIAKIARANKQVEVAETKVKGEERTRAIQKDTLEGLGKELRDMNALRDALAEREKLNEKKAVNRGLSDADAARYAELKQQTGNQKFDQSAFDQRMQEYQAAQGRIALTDERLKIARGELGDAQGNAATETAAVQGERGFRAVEQQSVRDKALREAIAKRDAAGQRSNDLYQAGDQAGSDAAAEEFRSATKKVQEIKAPPAIQTAELGTALTGYNGQIIKMQEGNMEAIQSIAGQLNQFKATIEQLQTQANQQAQQIAAGRQQ